MKVALCLSGQPRFYDITYELYYSRILERYNPDVFIHTWWSDDMVGTLYPCAKHAESRLSYDDRLVNSDTIDNLTKLYNPKLIKCDDYSTIEIPHKANYYQYYTQYAVKELLNEYEILNGFEYDLVIRTRFDLLIQQDIPYHNDDYLWVSSTCPYTDRYNDMFSFSNSLNYKKISNVYKNLNSFEEVGMGEMEWAFVSQIKAEELKVSTFPADYSTFDILRTDTANKFR